MPGRTKPKTPEGSVLSGVLQALRHYGFRPERRNVGAFPIEDCRGRRRYFRSGERGQADVSATVPKGPNKGKRVEIEVKAPGQRPRPEQIEYLRGCNETGAIGLWVDDAAVMPRVCQRLLDGWHVEIDEDGCPELVQTTYRRVQ